MSDPSLRRSRSLENLAAATTANGAVRLPSYRSLENLGGPADPPPSYYDVVKPTAVSRREVDEYPPAYPILDDLREIGDRVVYRDRRKYEEILTFCLFALFFTLFGFFGLVIWLCLSFSTDKFCGMITGLGLFVILATGSAFYQLDPVKSTFLAIVMYFSLIVGLTMFLNGTLQFLCFIFDLGDSAERPQR